MAGPLQRLGTALRGRYRIERELGRGGMATVYLATDLKHQREVALKVLHPELSAAIGSERFLREIEIAARLNHPHILPLHDSGEADGLLYYVMPYVRGESLRSRLNREKQLPMGEVARLTGEVADALSYAHRQGIVHRDIKPENILLEEGHAVVVDFGIARALSVAGGETLTQTGVAVGTPTYMSPEQGSGEHELDARSDLYSIACVTYEMITGRPPFVGPTVESVLRQHMVLDPPVLSALRRGVSPALEQVMRRALAKAPADRFATATEYAAAVEQAQAAGPLAAETWKAWVGRAAGLGLVVVAVFAAVMVGWPRLRGSGPPVSPTMVAVLPFTVRGSEEIGYLGEGMVDLLSTKLDGAGDWRSADARAVLGAIPRANGESFDPDRAGAVAERLGAGLYVLGNILEVGGQLNIDATLYRRNRRPVAVVQASVEGVPAQLFRLVDELAAQLLRGQRGGPGARVAQIAAVTTTSLPALKAYLEGESAFRAGRMEVALDAFQRAVALDSAFGLAHYRLSLAAEWAANTDLLEVAAEQAVRHAARLADQDRLLLEAFLTWRRGEADQAEQRYRAIVRGHPDEVEAWVQLGEVLFHSNPIRGRLLTESREPFERALALDPGLSAAPLHLARVAAYQRDLAAADSLVRQILRLTPRGDRAVEMRTLHAFTLGDEGEQARVAVELRGASDVPTILAVWDVGAMVRDPTALLRLVPLLTEPNRSAEVQALGHVWAAHAELARGRIQSASAELEAAEQLRRPEAMVYRALFMALPFLSPSRPALEELLTSLTAWNAAGIPPAATRNSFVTPHDSTYPQLREYLLGLVQARLGNAAAAQHHADALDRLGGSARARALGRGLAQGVVAAAALERRRPEEALRALQRIRVETLYNITLSSSFYSLALERYLRALALQQLGRGEEADQCFATLVGTSPNELIYLAPSYLRRGEIAERRGDRAAALAHYRHFVELWAECDAELRPVVDEVRRRIARLGA